jgi:hypothetical protein
MPRSAGNGKRVGSYHAYHHAAHLQALQCTVILMKRDLPIHLANEWACICTAADGFRFVRMILY